MDRVLIASTSLHLIDSLIIKHSFSDDFHLVYIGKENRFFDLIKTDFKSFLYLNETKGNKKIQTRIKNVKYLMQYVLDINPEEIIMGNDRKIENSVLIANIKNRYSYMDDGLHSYIPEKQHIFKYTLFEKKLKEIIYKNKLVLPKYIGAENYIQTAYLFRPDLANDYLKTKKIIELKPEIEYLNGYFKNFVNEKWQFKLKNAEKIVFLPHFKFINKEILKKIVTLINKKTLVKLHPRDNKTKINAEIIPNEIFSEAIFGFLNQNCQVYGYKTTAVLTGKWLRKELEIFNIGEYERIMEENGIKFFKI